MKHIPVLLNDVLKTLGDVQGKTIVDCTFGAGGYTQAFLERGANVIAFDRDPSVKPIADDIKSEYGDKFQFINAPFSASDTLPGKYDAIVFDLGISSMQIDQGARGFSFRHDAPLDMRMSMDGPTAAELIRKFFDADDVGGLGKILSEYGDIKNPRGLAQKILNANPKTTLELKNLIGKPKDVAPVFQALRIAVNDELGEIGRTLIDTVPKILKNGGICICVTFHSLEDRIVKNIFREWTTQPGDPRMPLPDATAPFVLLKTYTPSDVELENNPRARSAHLRAVRKT